MVQAITENNYFPSNFALKFIQHFPSLIHIELRVYSFHNCVFIIDLFLIRLEQLSYLKNFYDQDTLLDDPFTHEYIITKGCQTFHFNIIDEQMVNVKNNGQVIEIWLS
ncbi:unnamed protein product [Rotaria sp. Silwood2]|nr:unnamed protein product [Rotaria sp. Silwood2]